MITLYRVFEIRSTNNFQSRRLIRKRLGIEPIKTYKCAPSISTPDSIVCYEKKWLLGVKVVLLNLRIYIQQLLTFFLKTMVAEKAD